MTDSLKGKGQPSPHRAPSCEKPSLPHSLGLAFFLRSLTSLLHGSSPPLSAGGAPRAPKRNRSVTPKPLRNCPPPTKKLPKCRGLTQRLSPHGGLWPWLSWGRGEGKEPSHVDLPTNRFSPPGAWPAFSEGSGPDTCPSASFAFLCPSQQRVVLLSLPSRPVWRPPAPPVECGGHGSRQVHPSELTCSVMENTPDWAKVAQNKNAEYLTHDFYVDGTRCGPIWGPAELNVLREFISRFFFLPVRCDSCNFNATCGLCCISTGQHRSTWRH